MTDTNPHDSDESDAPDDKDIPATGSQTFTETTTKRVGDIGDDVYKQVSTTTDPTGMTKTKEIKTTAYCSCGVPIKETPDSYRCSRCTDLCCTVCHVEIGRRKHCQDCAEHEYDLSKPVYLTLLRLDEAVLAPSALVTTATVNGDPVLVPVNDTAATVLDRHYVTVDTDQSAAIDGDTPLSVQGREALHVGDQLYGDDPDVQELKDDLTLHNAANAR